MIRFSKHAMDKFAVLRRHGVWVPKRKVLATVQNPEQTDYSRLPLLIAQSALNARLVLRVVYRKEENDILIITFYPGRKSSYEKK